MSLTFLFIIFVFPVCLVSQNISETQIDPPICQSAKRKGEGPLKKFVVGGIPADRFEFPWLVNLIVKKSNGNEICGGSLIDWNLVLTAAHCVTEETIGGFETLENKNVKVTAGDFNIQCDDKSEQVSYPAAIIVHQNFKITENSLLNDIALVRLKPGFQHSLAVRRIPLSSYNIIDENVTNGTVAGWGSTLPDSELSSDVLMKVSIPVVKSGNCVIDSETQFCAGGSGKDSCRGDSGGPFMCGDEEYFVCGIVSYGPEFCGEKPGIYTNVFVYLGWIAQYRTEDYNYGSSGLPWWLYFIIIILSIIVFGGIVTILFPIFFPKRHEDTFGFLNVSYSES